MIRVGQNHVGNHVGVVVTLKVVDETVAISIFIPIINSVAISVLRERIVVQVVKLFSVSKAVIISVRIVLISAE